MKIYNSIFLAGLVALPTSALADWSGFYLGGTVGLLASDTVEESTTDSKTENHNPTGLFLGYQIQDKQFVYGVEYAASTSNTSSDGTDIDFEYNDLKARFGYDAGKFMPYGFVSYSVAHLSAFEEFTATGPGFGVGVDYAIFENFIVGGELTVRRYSDLTSSDFVDPPDANLNSSGLSIRAAYKF